MTRTSLQQILNCGHPGYTRARTFPLKFSLPLQRYPFVSKSNHERQIDRLRAAGASLEHPHIGYVDLDRGTVDRCTATQYNTCMIRSFRHRGLRRLYERDDPSRVAASLADRIALVLADIDDASKPRDIDLPGYRFHPLKGNMKGMWSISVSGNWRITFRFDDGDVYDVDLVDYH